MAEEEETTSVAEMLDHLPRWHQPGPGLSEEAARRQDLARYWMDKGFDGPTEEEGDA